MELSYLEALVTLATLHIVTAISPGPSVILVAHASAFDSRRSGLIAALAMGVGVSVWAAAALFGLGAFFTTNPNLFYAFQILGISFLLWMSYKMIAYSKSEGTKAPMVPTKGIFCQALQLQLSNPKVIIFFASIFISSLPLPCPTWFKVLILSVIFVNETLWYSILAVALSTQSAQKSFAKWKSTISVICGIVLAAIAFKLFLGVLHSF